MSGYYPTHGSRSAFLTWLAFLASIGVVAGSLYLSIGMGLVACPLCFYQRAFAMATCAVLAVGLLAGMGRTVPLSLLALPLAVAGLGVSGFHVYLEATDKLECPQGIHDIGGVKNLGSAPQQALGALAILTLLLLLDGGNRMGAMRLGGAAFVLGLLLGGASAFGCIYSAPPLKARDKPYDPDTEPLNICRPPYVPPK
jgi:disulfide bond formation protein DsbB